MSAPSVFSGIVKQVLSGDTIVIRDRPRDGPPPERIIVLSSITAGRLARSPTVNNPTANQEDPWAWKAREFLRVKLVGKEVTYVVENEQPSGRKYGVVYIGKSIAGENIALSVVEEGLATVRKINNAFVAEKNPMYKQLIEAEESARSQGKGRWATDEPDSAIREIVWSIDDPRAFVEQFGGKSLPAIVEHVRDGSTFHLTVLPNAEANLTAFHSIWVLLSGVKCPSFRLENGEQVGEPFAPDAQFFVESRLLQREVTFHPESSLNQNIVCSIIHPNGNVAEILLREGLARCVDWTLRLVSPVAGTAESYKAAERAAKERRLRLWKDFEPTQTNEKSDESVASGLCSGMTFIGQILEVGNGDNLTVRCPDGMARKVFFSSVRAPRLNGAQSEETSQRGRIRPLYDVPYMFEAREYLRRFVGKQASVTVEYIQPKSAVISDDRICANIEIDGNNLGESTVSQGLASVVRYRSATDSRANNYAALLSAEEVAQNKSLGIHGNHEPPIHRIADLSGNVAKSRQFLPFLQRQSKIDAVVEFVINASRMRVYVPRESCVFTFLLSGVQCPRRERILPDGTVEKGERFGKEAYELVHGLCMQRDVNIDVEVTDRAGNFIGWLFVPTLSTSTGDNIKGGRKKKKVVAVDAHPQATNMSVLLVSHGFATVTRSAAVQRSVYFQELMRAEEAARTSKLGIWSSEEFVSQFEAELGLSANGAEVGTWNGFTPAGDVATDYLDDLASLDINPIPVEDTSEFSKVVCKAGQVTAVPPTSTGTESLRFFFQQMADSGTIAQISHEMNNRTTTVAGYMPQRGELCAARFSSDNCWYRARVLRKSSSFVLVQFVDFGNEERINSVDFPTNLAPLPTKAMNTIPVQATEYRLACIQLPPGAEDRAYAERAFALNVENKEIRLGVQLEPFTCCKESGKPVPGVTILSPNPELAVAGGSTSIAAELDVGELLLSEGLVCVEPMPNEVRRRIPRDLLQRYLEAQNNSKSVRKNIWRYGDFRVDSTAN